MRIAVVGGGIVGACTSWALSKRGAQVTLFERGRPMQETSSASSKLLHGGLRYLETGQFRLVRKALLARTTWLQRAPQFCQQLELLLPIYQDGSRSRWIVAAGIKLYDLLARGSGFPKSRWLTAAEVEARHPGLVQTALLGAYSFYDAQMDDYALGNWVVTQLAAEGVDIRTQCEITDFNQLSSFDRIVNATGPWAEALRQTQPGKSAYKLDLVRGSHILLKRPIETALLLPVPRERRVVFVLPYKGATLLGTTEIRQSEAENPGPSEHEIQYLLEVYNHYLSPHASTDDVIGSFAGVRPLVFSSNDPTNATREWAFEKVDNVLHIYGGKWTTALLEGEEAAKRILE